jgi:hypothetical protein
VAAPLVKRLHEAMRARGVALVQISTTAEKRDLARYVAAHAHSGVVLHDPADEDEAVGYARYKITGFPSFIVVDRKGRISGAWKHYYEGQTEVKLRAELERALGR